jgi:pimeloyl-ACP methyl ester carboxylesterase
MAAIQEKLVHIPTGTVHIEGLLDLPSHARGLVLFAHGSGSSRHSPRNQYVAQVLQATGIGTLLMDLLTPAEDGDYQTRFDIPLLTRRLLAATQWSSLEPDLQTLPLGYFGASTGAAAALQAAAASGEAISAVVSRGGRPDLAGEQVLQRVRCPTLLLVGGRDEVVIELNRKAYTQLPCVKELVIVPDATHLFVEPGTLETVARQAAQWFTRYLCPATASS